MAKSADKSDDAKPKGGMVKMLIGAVLLMGMGAGGA